MKILYATQATGNGHFTRANEIIPILRRYGEVDLLTSGMQADIGLDHPVKYRYYGCSFIFGRRGGIDFWATLRTLRIPTLIRDIRALPVEEYDLVLSDFEPISAWAGRLRGVPVYGISHQAALADPDAARPSGCFPLARLILTYFAPTTYSVGFYYRKLRGHILPPVIRKEIRQAAVSDNGHYTVYLPAYSDSFLYRFFSRTEGRFHVFSKQTKKFWFLDNVQFHPVDRRAYVRSLASGKGLISGGGFEGPAEALFLGKKLLVVPMKNQYEQQCNAEALRELGVIVLNELAQYDDFIARFKRWMAIDSAIRIDCPEDICETAVEDILNQHFLRGETSRRQTLQAG